ncbi:MAG: hypothetical protein ISS01_01470 [Nanoarchaeota archaeon]|nr:hypothetical protein [Nanoarchaeota archaeon]
MDLTEKKLKFIKRDLASFVEAEEKIGPPFSVKVLDFDLSEEKNRYLINITYNKYKNGVMRNNNNRTFLMGYDSYQKIFEE